MNIKQKVMLLPVMAMIMSAIGLSGLFTQPTLAITCPSGQIEQDGKCVTGCGGVATAIISCSQNNKGGDLTNNGVWGLLLLILNILTAGVGILAIGGLVYAAILYTSAEDNSSQVTKAKTTMFNVVIGIVAYMLMFAFLQYIIPGGVFN